MKKRWKDRIQILSPSARTYDAWGHLNQSTHQQVAEVWADVKPVLSATRTAIVTVRMPFEHDNTSHILWQDQAWKIIQGPAIFPDVRLVQFKIQQL